MDLNMPDDFKNMKTNQEISSNYIVCEPDMQHEKGKNAEPPAEQKRKSCRRKRTKSCRTKKLPNKYDPKIRANKKKKRTWVSLSFLAIVMVKWRRYGQKLGSITLLRFGLDVHDLWIWGTYRKSYLWI